MIASAIAQLTDTIKYQNNNIYIFAICIICGFLLGRVSWSRNRVRGTYSSNEFQSAVGLFTLQGTSRKSSRVSSRTAIEWRSKKNETIENKNNFGEWGNAFQNSHLTDTVKASTEATNQLWATFLSKGTSWIPINQRVCWQVSYNKWYGPQLIFFVLPPEQRSIPT